MTWFAYPFAEFDATTKPIVQQSPVFPASDTCITATWTSPAVPDGTGAVTFGLTLDSAL